MNKFEVIGRLVKDSELRYTKDSKEICNFTLAINNTKEDKTFLKITTFGKLAKTINEYIHKGDLILVEGMIKNNNYEDDKGNKHYEYTFIGNKAEFLSNKTNYTPKEESVSKESKNELDDQAFIDFGNKISSEESDIAF